MTTANTAPDDYQSLLRDWGTIAVKTAAEIYAKKQEAKLSPSPVYVPPNAQDSTASVNWQKPALIGGGIALLLLAGILLFRKK